MMSKQTDRLLTISLLVTPYLIAAIPAWFLCGLALNWIDNGNSLPGFLVLLISGPFLLVLALTYIIRVAGLTIAFLKDEFQAIGFSTKRHDRRLEPSETDSTVDHDQPARAPASLSDV